MPKYQIDPSKTKAVIFDVNGTMVRDRIFHKEAYVRVFKEMGVELSDQDFEEKVANHLGRDIWTSVLGDELTEAKIISLSQQKEAKYRELVSASDRFVPGVRELIKKLHQQKIRLAVATTASYSSTELNGLNIKASIRDFLEVVVI